MWVHCEEVDVMVLCEEVDDVRVYYEKVDDVSSTFYELTLYFSHLLFTVLIKPHL